MKKIIVLGFLLLILLAFPACTGKTKTAKERTKVLAEQQSEEIKSGIETAETATGAERAVISDEEIAGLENEINEIEMLMQDIESEEDIDVGDFSGI